MRFLSVIIFLYFLPISAFCQSTDTVRTVSASIALVSVQVLAANTKRRGLTIYNNSANSVYLTWGATSSSNTCTRILATFTQFDMFGPVVYLGPISAIRNAGSGTLILTEYLLTAEKLWP